MSGIISGTESHKKGRIVQNLAKIFLIRNGYKILKNVTEVDEYYPYDYLVEKENCIYLVEVKRKDINTKNLGKEDRIFDFGWPQFSYLDQHQDKVLIVIGWVTENNEVGFGIFKLDDFTDKSPNRKKGKRLKLKKEVNYSPIQNPSNFKPILDSSAK